MFTPYSPLPTSPFTVNRLKKKAVDKVDIPLLLKRYCIDCIEEQQTIYKAAM